MHDIAPLEIITMACAFSVVVMLLYPQKLCNPCRRMCVPAYTSVLDCASVAVHVAVSMNRRVPVPTLLPGYVCACVCDQPHMSPPVCHGDMQPGFAAATVTCT